jgi:hypothetical protein
MKLLAGHRMYPKPCPTKTSPAAKTIIPMSIRTAFIFIYMRLVSLRIAVVGRNGRMDAYREVLGSGVTSVIGLLGLWGVVGAAGTTAMTGGFRPAIDVGSGKPCG